MHIDLTVFSDAMVVIVAYYLVLFLLGVRGVAVPYVTPGDGPLIVIIVPARNEELVIGRTVRYALENRYRKLSRVLVVDDASTDKTGEIVTRMAGGEPRLRVLRRSAALGGQGKSAVLNHAYGALCAWMRDGDPWLAGYSASHILVCIVDADGQLSSRALDDASAFFSSPDVGGVQLAVQIRGSDESALARMQDIEFVGFSFMVQTARDRLGSVGLGGNGQFTRLSALAGLGECPWAAPALTEDLDLGIRLMMGGWRLRFCSTSWVDQQGLRRMRPLLRQRTRWAQGHYQCWRHIPALMRTKAMRRINRFDTLAYLVLICMVMVVSGVLVLRALGAAGVLVPTNEFMPWLGTGVAFRSTIFLLSWLPILLTVATYQRYAVHRLRWWEAPLTTVLFAAYVYLWAFATLRAWARFALRRGNWVKTPRLALPMPQPAPASQSVASALFAEPVGTPALFLDDVAPGR